MNDQFEMIEDILDKISIEDIEYYIDITDQKNHELKNQRYENAAKLRDKQREFVRNNTSISEIDRFINYNTPIIKKYVIQRRRDEKIDTLIDG